MRISKIVELNPDHETTGHLMFVDYSRVEPVVKCFSDIITAGKHPSYTQCSIFQMCMKIRDYT